MSSYRLLSAKAAVGSAVIILSIFLGWHFYPRWFSADRHRALAERGLAMKVLGEYLARAYPGEEVLLIANPFTQQKGRPPEIYAFHQSELDGLKKGLGSNRFQVGFPRLRSEGGPDPTPLQIPPGATTPLSYLVAENSFDDLLRAHRNARVVVSVIGLPISLHQARFWEQPNIKLALLLPDLKIMGDAVAIRHAVQREKVAALILDKPGAPTGKALGKEDQADFNSRFLLVTAENIETVIKEYPQLF